MQTSCIIIGYPTIAGSYLDFSDALRSTARAAGSCSDRCVDRRTA